MPNDNLSCLNFRVRFVVENAGERIAENCQRFFKVNAVNGSIGTSFLQIPLKLDSHSRPIISRQGPRT